MRTPTLFTLFALTACGDKEPSDVVEPADSAVEDTIDGDGDGSTAELDCDDADPGVFPGAVEVCDGLDNNCDGETDEGVLSTYYADSDGDGHGDPDVLGLACALPGGYVETALDCDDGDAGRSPDAEERCDGLDNDCDGDVDEELLVSRYADADGDGYGDITSILLVCADAAGTSAVAGDCDDADPTTNPDAVEACYDRDRNCDGDTDELGLCEDCADGLDNDGDGLLDCEDGDCALDSACVEDCADEVDNDDDGLSDCYDDDCWPSCSVVVRSALHSGSASFFKRTATSSYGRTREQAGVGRSLVGDVSVSVSSVVFNCDWSVAEARFAYSYDDRGKTRISTFSQSDYEVLLSSGCPIEWEAVIPPDLKLTRHTVTSPWGVWYQGGITAIRSRGPSETHGFSDYNTTTATIGVLDPATVTWTY
ncbi:hypothetical protein L6R46_19925 [Myxococcota bacterium]|nr:hypothetical protein [Myxococcota bacterium]